MKATLRESEIKVQSALQTALQESEANMQHTLQAAHDKIDARFHNQQRHHDEDIRALYDQITTLRQDGWYSSTQWEGETPEESSEETPWSQVSSASRTSTGGRTPRSEPESGPRRYLAEYEALIAGLRLARDLGVRNLRCKTDSQLVASQMNEEYQTQEPWFQKYYDSPKVNPSVRRSAHHTCTSPEK